MKNVNKLILGSAQFGSQYGINSQGRPTLQQVRDIIELARKCNVQYIDTAYDYCESEEILGQIKTMGSFRIISKYSNVGNGLSVFKQCFASMAKLGVPSLYGYLVHNCIELQENPSIWEEMRALRNDGLVKKIGMSLYGLDELDYVIEHFSDIDIIQIPYNILDRRYEPLLAQLSVHGIEIYSRSVFLQGLFFKDSNTFCGNIIPLRDVVTKIQRYCSDNGISVGQLCLSYVCSNKYVNGVLIGVDSETQLKKDIEDSLYKLTNNDIDFISSLIVQNKNLLYPYNW